MDTELMVHSKQKYPYNTDKNTYEKPISRFILFIDRIITKSQLYNRIPIKHKHDMGNVGAATF